MENKKTSDVKSAEKQNSLGKHLSILNDDHVRGLGAIYTPMEFADYLTGWAIQEPSWKILDLGIGHGVFAFSAYKRLIDLGARRNSAARQIYGTEKHTQSYDYFIRVAKENNVEFPNICPGDFFDIEFPQVEAIIGNPPYVRRMYLENVDKIRRSLNLTALGTVEQELSRLTDLYVYFLLRAFAFLKNEGRLAVVLADSWLNAVYGRELKKQLEDHFIIERLVSFDHQVFDAEVKAVLLLATKKPSGTRRNSIDFIRVKNGLPVKSLELSIRALKKKPDVAISSIQQKDLKADNSWSIYFKAPEAYEIISTHGLMSSFEEQALTRIGIQTLAKEFFVLTPEQATLHNIESEFLKPLAYSTKSVTGLVITPNDTPSHYLFYCSRSKADLTSTNALKYILQGEAKEVQVRGKGETVIGYHNKERIKEQNRPFWYDIKSEAEKRDCAPILIPRLIYQGYKVVWNQAEHIPGELFIEFILPDAAKPDIEVYLAVLVSSITEIILRSQAQLYGGGTYNISPGQIRKMPLLNVVDLKQRVKEDLRKAYQIYLGNRVLGRNKIDNIIYDALGFDTNVQVKLTQVLADMRSLATSIKQSV